MAGTLLSANRMIRLVTNGWAGAVCSRRGRKGLSSPAIVGATVTTLPYALSWGSLAIPGGAHDLGNMLVVIAQGAVPGRVGGCIRRRAGAVGGPHAGSDPDRHYLSPILGGYPTDRTGFTPTVVLFGMVTAVSAGTAWWDFFKARRRGNRHETDAEGIQAGGLDEASPSFPSGPSIMGPAEAPREIGQASRRPSLFPGSKNTRRLALAYATGFAQGFVTFGIIMGTLPLLLLQRSGQKVNVLGVVVGVATLSGWFLGAGWIVELLVAPRGGCWADSWGRGTTIAGGALLQASMLVVLAFATRPEVIFATACALFTGAVLFSVSLDAAAAHLAAQSVPARVLSRYATTQDVGAALGPFIGYALSGAVGLPITYAAVAVVLVSIAGVFSWDSRSQRER